MDNKKIVFSGIQPTGSLHIGNYIGAIQQWIGLQEECNAFFCIVDLHAITVRQDPAVLKENIINTAALFLACGVDPQKSHLFIQSENPDHTYLAWILNCITSFGQLERMTQFKDKSQKQEIPTAGLFNYPVLMASDILLYKTNAVPVGEDQKQHIELARDIAERFNKEFGDTFTIPEPLIQTETARIMSLSDPLSKMSKSDTNPNGSINLLDSPDVIVEKIKRAVTDSGDQITKRDDKPAVSNLLTIYSSVSDKSISQLETIYSAQNYATFKSELAEAVVSFLTPIQNRYAELLSERTELERILTQGAEFAKVMSLEMVKVVNQRVGLGK